MGKMYRLFFLSCLLLLAVHSPLVSAQTCNSTTGTYQSCCSSLNKKTVSFQGREYRVYCDAEIGPATIQRGSSPDVCTKKCPNDSPFWSFDTLRAPGRCSCGSFYPAPKQGKVSFVPIDSEVANDLDKCRADSKTCTDQAKDCQTKLGTCSSDLATCKAGLGNRQGQCDQSCPRQLQRCKNRLDRVEKACPGQLSTCNAALQKEREELQRYQRECPYLLATCPPGQVKDSTNPCNCRSKPGSPDKKPDKNAEKPTKPPRTCKNKIANIGKAKYGFRCHEVPRHLPIPQYAAGEVVQNMLECGRRCTALKCLWASWQPQKRKCFFYFEMWDRPDTEFRPGSPYVVLQRWDKPDRKALGI